MDIQTVVVGFDGSECSQRAVDAAVSIMNEGGTIHVVSAYDPPSSSEINQAYSSVPAELASSIDLLAGPRGELEEVAKRLADDGHAVVDYFVNDDPATAILAVAEAAEADMIVVGSRGLGRASQILRGSVSTKVAHHSRVDFMVVH